MTLLAKHNTLVEPKQFVAMSKSLKIRHGIVANKLSEIIAQHEEIQICNIGCGFNTVMLDFWDLPKLTWFDFDQKMIVDYKQKWHQKDNYNVIEIDFEDASLESVLSKNGFNPNIFTIWLVEGLLVYISDANVTRMITDITTHTKNNCCILFDLPDRDCRKQGDRYRFHANQPMNWIESFGFENSQNITLNHLVDGVPCNLPMYMSQYVSNEVLIIGGGYLGSNVAQLLDADKYTVSVTTTSAAKIDKLKDTLKVNVLEWNGSNDTFDSIKATFDSAKYILVSIRSLTHDVAALTATLQVIATNVKDYQRVVFVSSTDVYTNKKDIVDESDAPATTNTAAPQYMEQLLDTVKQLCVVRTSQIIGPGVDTNGNTRDFKSHYDKILRLTKGVLPGTGDYPVNITHVDLLSEFICKSITENIQGTFNLCSTLDYNRKELYNRISESYNLPKITWDSLKTPFPQLDQPRISVDKVTQRGIDVHKHKDCLFQTVLNIKSNQN